MTDASATGSPEGPSPAPARDRPVLEVEGLVTRFRGDPSGKGGSTAVDGVSLELAPGETLGLVGESGSGKTVLSWSILGLLPGDAATIERGSIAYLGRDLVRLPAAEMRPLRGPEIAMVFQEPATALNPVLRTGDQVAETLRQHRRLSRREARRRTVELFREVGIPEPERRFDFYPHEMSGGQKQRVMIAMALCCDPRVLIADEPTTALDVTIQAQVLELLARLRDARDMAMLFVSHDFGVIAEIADRVAVMVRGRVVEQGPLEEVLLRPQHPYTRGLLACRPRLGSGRRRLPTMSDFVEERILDDGTVEVLARDGGETAAAGAAACGRPRLLHPSERLAELGYGTAAASAARTVDAGSVPLLEVEGLTVRYPTSGGALAGRRGFVRAVDDVTFEIYRGQTLGLVGESGSGKTTIGLAALRLLPTSIGQAGRVRFDGQDLAELDRGTLRRLRRRMQIVLQDPHASLDPRRSVEATLVEAMSVHGLGADTEERRSRAVQLLEEVGLGAEYLGRLPRELSTGQRQRVSVARALAVEPELVVLDEAVSALDVSVRAQVLNLLVDLQEERDLTYLFISHDLSVVELMADMVAVMEAGGIVELGPAGEIYRAPRQEATRRLIAAVPDDSPEAIERRAQQRRSRAGAKTT